MDVLRSDGESVGDDGVFCDDAKIPAAGRHIGETAAITHKRRGRYGAGDLEAAKNIYAGEIIVVFVDLRLWIRWCRPGLDGDPAIAGCPGGKGAFRSVRCEFVNGGVAGHIRLK